MTDDNKPSNPLVKLFNWLGVIGGILSLSSMAETWSSDLLKWKGFIGDLIDSYQGIVHPIFHFLFGWLPFIIPTGAIDYFVVGMIISGSLGKVWLELFELHTWLITAITWPLWLVLLLISLLDFDSQDRKENLQVVQWLGAIVLGFMTLLALNAYV